MKTFCIKTFFVFITFIISLCAQSNNSRLLILPFDANGIDPVYVETSESILRVEINRLSKMDIITKDRTEEILNGSKCYTTECAVTIGKEAGADKVAGCKLAALGEKIIVQYFLVDVSTGKPELMDQLSAVNLEDLDQVMKRIASNIVENKSTEENAQVGNIVQEETTEPLRRSSNKNIGLSFGYLFPQEGYDGDNKSFTINLHLDYEMQELAVGMLLGIRDGFAMNVYSDYLFTRTDICPYMGGGFGFHWVSHQQTSYIADGFGPAIDNSKKDSDGFELTLNTGLRLLHTYNFQILLNLEYIVTFNDYHDKAIVFTLGIL
ncbi:MAG TPA: hypothetical protein VKD08_10140 [Ignavibacteriaceae bacterium]|nr:hypothetical protein [Ignavibacteriaceae bacterium]